MKSLYIFMSVAVLSLSTTAFAESDAQKSFDQLKTLAGTWQASYEGKSMQATLRVTSMGNTIMHEMKGGDGPEDPITMITVDGDRLLMTHYCDAGNQPRFVGKLSPDGKIIDFSFVDITNLSDKQLGHMQHVVFTFIDPDHHTEDWTFLLASGKAESGHLDMRRVK